MNILLAESFSELDDEEAVKLAQTSGAFANIFDSANFWKQRADKIGLKHDNLYPEVADLRDQIRKYNNSQSIPSHVICTHFKSPHTSWSPIDMCFHSGIVYVLYKTTEGISKVSYRTQGSVSESEKMYEGIISRNGTLEKKTEEFFVAEHPRAFKKLELESIIKSWNLDVIHCKDYLVERRWPFHVMFWKSDRYDTETQEKLQQLGNFEIKHVYIGNESLSVIFYNEQTSFYTVCLWEKGELRRDIYEGRKIDEAVFDSELMMWLFR